jgi:hypothetical protein
MTNPTAERLPPHAVPGDGVAGVAACTLAFAVRNPGLRTVTGPIPVTSATVTAGPDGQPLGLRAELDAHGIDTGNQRRDSDLRGPGSSPPADGPRSPSKRAASNPATPAGWCAESSPSRATAARSTSTSPAPTYHQAIRPLRSTCTRQATWTAAQRASAPHQPSSSATGSRSRWPCGSGHPRASAQPQAEHAMEPSWYIPGERLTQKTAP